MNPKVTVQTVCGEFLVPNKFYPGNIPAALQTWYAYCSDGGHCIICCLKQDYKQEGDLTDYLLPVPVKSVLRGYQVLRNYIVVDLPYSQQMGLITQPEDDEF